MSQDVREPGGTVIASVTGLRRGERLDALADVVMTEGTVRIDDLVDRFAVSMMTIHRDVDALVGRGLVRKSRGSVTATATSLFEASTAYRARQQVAAKAALASAALARIEAGTSIIVDDSTTFLSLGGSLADKAPLIVITNFVPLVSALAGAQGVEVVCTGGTLHPWCDSFMGDMTVRALQGIRADVVLMSTSAITDGVCYHQRQETVTVKRAMMEAASTRILAVDHSKLARRALYALCPLTDFDVVIVDELPPAELQEALSAAGTELVVTSPADGGRPRTA